MSPADTRLPVPGSPYFIATSKNSNEGQREVLASVQVLRLVVKELVGVIDADIAIDQRCL